ncbi:MAG: ABC transporter permease subunit [Chloroflexi bacterium]|nr:ABC transporter permease subunit [Chloroflexota bacterium]
MKSETTISLPYQARRNYAAWFQTRLLRPVLSHLVMIAAVVFIMFPMIYALLLATQTPSEYYNLQFLPGSSLIENISFAWNRINMGRLLANTAFVAITVAIGKIILSVIGAFAFVYFDFRGKTLLFGLILVTHMLPLPVRIVPTFELVDALGWTNSFQALTIPFFASATGILLFRQLYQTIPPALADAARIDGATPLQFLYSIVIPLSATNIAALFLIEFIYMWNQYLWPLIIANADTTRMVQIGLRQLVATDAAVEWHYVMSGVLISAIPPLLLLILLQRNLIRGIALYEDK